MHKPPSYPTLSKGDKVRLIFTDEIGMVIHQIDRDTVLVDVNGIDIPAFIEHLELLSTIITPKSTNTIVPNQDKNNPKNLGITTVSNSKIPIAQKEKQQAIEKIKQLQQNAPLHDDLPDKGLQLAMQPFWRKDGIIDYFLLHLINQTGKTIDMEYQMYLDTHTSTVFELKKTISRRETIILNTLQYDDLNENPEMIFTLTLMGNDISDNMPLYEKSIRPKARMLRNRPVWQDNINAEAYLHEICKQWPQNKPALQVAKPSKEVLHPILEKIKQFEAEQERQNPNYEKPPIKIHAKQRVIDLHIEQLVPSYKHLKNGEILHIQLAHFEKNLQEAILHREPNMIVIHGNGKGKLKQEIFNILRQYPEVCNFDNSYDHRFGFGASIIEMSYTK